MERNVKAIARVVKVALKLVVISFVLFLAVGILGAWLYERPGRPATDRLEADGNSAPPDGNSAAGRAAPPMSAAPEPVTAPR